MFLINSIRVVSSGMPADSQVIGVVRASGRLSRKQIPDGISRLKTLSLQR